MLRARAAKIAAPIAWTDRSGAAWTAEPGELTWIPDLQQLGVEVQVRRNGQDAATGSFFLFGDVPDAPQASHTIDLGSLFIDDGHQQTGFGTMAVATILQRARDAGVRAARVDAVPPGGGYAWARAGFELDGGEQLLPVVADARETLILGTRPGRGGDWNHPRRDEILAAVEDLQGRVQRGEITNLRELATTPGPEFDWPYVYDEGRWYPAPAQPMRPAKILLRAAFWTGRLDLG